ncbi:hypothetical protein NQ318_016142 [Aromia moschata]|uniref:Uncharacterized protein n=1 Tax=Aromia moschata TaxID=1265417 RepID=A0AAV8XYX3_9CUCU|nr:hypothetical protein NQ318_016142 [Aromia moschata]
MFIVVVKDQDLLGELQMTSRPPAPPPMPGNPDMPDKSPEYPVINPGLPVQCQCSPGTESRSPQSHRNSPSPSPLSPGGPDDLSITKNPHPVENFDINKSAATATNHPRINS